jgi:hypothetical protein
MSVISEVPGQFGRPQKNTRSQNLPSTIEHTHTRTDDLWRVCLSFSLSISILIDLATTPTTACKLSSGSSGHTGGTSPGQTRKKPEDLSPREREDRGRGKGGGV